MSSREEQSHASWIASEPKEKQAARLKRLARTEAEQQALFYDWRFWARPEQLPPTGDWLTWAIIAGRFFGKTRSGAEWVRANVEGPTPLTAPKGGARMIAFVAADADEARKVMTEGPSGILALSPPEWRPKFESSNKLLTWPNGAQAELFSAHDPESLRGPQHDLAWCDELAKWRYCQDAWDQLQFGLRLGERPRQCITTTPRPTKALRAILADKLTIITGGPSADNKANVAPTAYRELVKRYGGTRLGRQELNAEILEDVLGALWTRAGIDELRVAQAPDLRRVVVAIDPAGSSGEDADETGIIVAAKGVDGHGYVLEDLSGRMTPDAWGRAAVNAYRRHKADRIVAEYNFGAEMVGHVVRTVEPNVAFKAVHAHHGKVARAEPVAALDEQGRVHHVGSFPRLEDQMCAFTTDFDPKTAGYSPDRVDAMVWALTELMLGGAGEPFIRSL